MKHLLVGTLLVCLPVVAVAVQEASSHSEVIEIDGRKNPELVPAYRAWGYALRLLSISQPIEGRRLIADGLAEHLSAADEALIFKEADRVVALQADCVKRAMEARAPLARLEAAGKPITERLSTMREVDARMWDIELGCRWQVLYTRDRLVARLTPAAVTALLSFVELKKRGMSFSIPKGGLERFRQPQ